ncbi:MAG: aminoacyl-tRNA deacylase [Gaiellaceae bacterium]
MTAWPEPVERVARFLRETGTEARVEEFGDGTPTAEDAARAAGCKLDQIVKSLVFVCDGDYVLALVPGDQRGDAKRIAAAAGARKARVAGAEQVEDATGFEPGAVAPFPLPKVQTVLVDRRLLVHEFVWIGAGSHSHIAQLTPGDLVRLTKARTADLVEQRAPAQD